MGWIVRRLTPTECERLQGFPDGHTAIEGASDSARYRALGNSMAVPVMRWIGERIQAVEDETPSAAAIADMAADRREELAAFCWVEIGGFCESCAKFRDGDGFTYCDAQRRKMGPDDFCSRWRPWTVGEQKEV